MANEKSRSTISFNIFIFYSLYQKSQILIRISTVFFTWKSKQSFKSYLTWFFEEFWNFPKFITQDLKTYLSEGKPPSIIFVALTPFLKFDVQHIFAGSASLKNEQPKAVVIPSKPSFYRVKIEEFTVIILRCTFFQRTESEVQVCRRHFLLRTTVLRYCMMNFTKCQKSKQAGTGPSRRHI